MLLEAIAAIEMLKPGLLVNTARFAGLVMVTDGWVSGVPPRHLARSELYNWEVPAWENFPPTSRSKEPGVAPGRNAIAPTRSSPPLFITPWSRSDQVQS